ncbi:hypothetical protein [Brevundimonas lenta]|uniref:Lipoprotein n=1 Tax=Brevundimonas lenta TaxID=424796 RepID=A0A7W6JAF6_9CAUL|nr:hypothetical protein [Brevundimonas lenta]MBB4081509.1 hypothetical protein [Brevundimonas lenta]
MRRLILPALLFLAACSPESEPEGPGLSFRVDSGALAWSVADGAPAALVLSRETTPGTARPVLIISCDGLKTGGLDVRLFRAEPTLTPLELTAGAATLTVPGQPGQVGDQTRLKGEGELPADWAGAIAGARMLKLRYGDQGIEVQGPGREMADAFGRHCRTLERA